jgi:hypothetical protein
MEQVGTTLAGRVRSRLFAVHESGMHYICSCSNYFKSRDDPAVIYSALEMLNYDQYGLWCMY